MNPKPRTKKAIDMTQTPASHASTTTQPPIYLEDLTWPQPTRASDVLHVVSEVIEVTPSRSKPDRGMVSVRSETRNQHGDVLQVANVRIVVPRRPGASKAAPA